MFSRRSAFRRATPGLWVQAVGATLLVLALVITFGGRGSDLLNRWLGEGLGAGTPYHTTWNVLFVLAGILLIAAGALVRRRERAAR